MREWTGKGKIEIEKREKYKKNKRREERVELRKRRE